MSDNPWSTRPSRSHFRILGAVGLLAFIFFFLVPSRQGSVGRIDSEIELLEGTNGAFAAPVNTGSEKPSPPGSSTWTTHEESKPLAGERPSELQDSSKPAEDVPPETAEYCDKRFGSGYVEAFTHTAVQYCDSDSTANLTCFSHKASDKAPDSFCIGSPALFDFAHRGSIHIDCKIRDVDPDERLRGIPEFRDFPTYWYETGPKAIFDKHFNVDRMEDPPPESKDVGFLIQREENNQNLWHTLMEIMSLTLSLDVLRQTTNPYTGKPFFSDEDIERSQAVFTDRLPHGPYWDLWTLFAGKPSIRMTEISSRFNIGLMQVVVPLPGGSNPFWQGDWTEINCGKSPLLEAFVQRVLAFYEIRPTLPPRAGRKLQLTLIDRRSKRRLLHQDELVAALTAAHPDVEVKVLDFARLSLAKQIQEAHDADILVGVHGAGLAHGMFLQSSSAIVEFQPPKLDHHGFSNIARFLGHKYFRGQGVAHNDAKNTGDWKEDDVLVEQATFLRVIGEAVSGLQRQV